MFKKWTTDTWNNISEPQKHHVKWKKPDTKEYILYYSVTEMKFKPDKTNLWR